MNNLANKEKNLNSLLEKLSNLSKSYTHESIISEKLKMERENFLNEKNELETKHNKLLREHKYLKKKNSKLRRRAKQKN